MSRNGAGDFDLLATFATAGQAPSATSHNAIMEDIASGLSESINVDGTKAFAAAQSMGGFKLTSVGTGTARTDAAPLGQVQDGKANWVAAGGTADAITATYSPAITALVDGQECCVRAGFANATTTPTFAPNGLTARTIVKSGGVALEAGDISGADHELILRYKLASTRWELLNPAVGTSILSSSNTWTALQTINVTNATTNAINNVLKLAHSTSGTAAANFGTGLLYQLENAAGTLIDAGSVDVSWVDATDTSEDSRVIFKTMVAGAAKTEAAYVAQGLVVGSPTGDDKGAGTVNAVSLYNNGAQLVSTGTAPLYACRAWVVFDGTGTPAITASGNVTSITDNGVGDYTITMTTALPDANYAVTGSAFHATRNVVVTVDSTTTPTTTVFRIRVGAIDLNAATAQADAYDSTRVSVAVFR